MKTGTIKWGRSERREKPRILAVEHLGYNLEAKNEHEVPLIRLKGRWLRRVGFLPGGRVLVEVESGRLVLTPQK